MKPNATPRTLADCHFAIGYSSANPARTGSAAADMLLAVALGVVVGVLLVLGAGA